jgi:hypothetical protein
MAFGRLGSRVASGWGRRVSLKRRISGLVGAVQKQHLEGQPVGAHLQHGLLGIFQRLVRAGVHHDCHALPRHDALAQRIEHRRRQVVDAEVADVLQRLQGERLARARHA